jgi:hypothetical protein
VIAAPAQAEVEALGFDEKLAIAEWMKAHEGEGGFIPAAVRRMPLQTRLMLAFSEEKTEAWRQRERLRCAKSAHYLIEQYGSIEPPTGAPIPFELWDEQIGVLNTLSKEERIYVLKARRLGLSWLVLHYALWIAGFDIAGLHARILFLSKNQGDAGKMLERVKRIHGRLPAFLRPVIGDSDSATTFDIRAASILSLPATPSAARQETAALVVLDEFAFVKDGKAGDIWTAVQPTIEGGGKIAVVSTGNGTTGDGAQFADLWLKAQAGESEGRAVFLPWTVRPDRTQEWVDKERTNYESDEAFDAEYPLEPEQALAGDRSIKVYPPEGIAAATKIGAALWDSPIRQALIEEGIEIGTDWGDFQTFTTYAVALPGGGIYFIDELVQPHIEPQRASWRILRHDPGGVRDVQGGKAPMIASRADASPAGTNASFISVLMEAQNDDELRGRIPEQHVRVPFGVYKEGGGDTKGVNTAAFLKWLFRRSADLVEKGGSVESAHAVIAIHPRCKLLLSQLPNLERDPKTGKIRKPSLDPKHPERGDHGCDSMIPTAAGRAKEWVATKDSDE